MVRSVNVITEVTCNRCGKEDKWFPETPDYVAWEWSEFSQNYQTSVKMDLCPSCTREIKDWIRNGR